MFIGNTRLCAGVVVSEAALGHNNPTKGSLEQGSLAPLVSTQGHFKAFTCALKGLLEQQPPWGTMTPLQGALMYCHFHL